MYRRGAHNWICIVMITMLSIVLLDAPAALGDWLPNPTMNVDLSENMEQGANGASSPNISGLDNGFRPEVDGFSFNNYGNEIEPVDLTAVEMQRLFGNVVCAGDNECTLIPNARRWMEENNKEMADGHCEGMAVLSLLFYYDLADPQTFGSATTHDLEIEGNELLQREIAYWWATQTTSPAQEDSIGGPAEVIKTLEETFLAGENASDTWTVGVSTEKSSAGHAITPFALKDEGNGVYQIYVYDNNYPDETKVIDVDTNDNTFSYVTSTNPNEEASTYEGQGLNLSGTNGRLVQQKCDFCYEDNSSIDSPSEKSAKPAKTAYVQVWHEGYGGEWSMLIRDDNGRRLGRLTDGSPVNEIPGARVHEFRTDNAQIQKKSPKGNMGDYLYLLPSGINYSVSLNGSQFVKQEVTSIGPGYYTEVEGLALVPGSLDQVDFSSTKKGYLEVGYVSAGNASPRLKAGINERNGSAYEFLVMKNCAKGNCSISGDETRMGIDRETNRLKIKSDGNKSDELYDLKVVRLNKNGTEIFSHNGISLDDGDALIVDYSSWEGEGHSMSISIDKNDDGEVDRAFSLSDEGGSYEEVVSENDQTTEDEADVGDPGQDQAVDGADGE